MSLYMETTRISVDKTAGELCMLLARSGATKIQQDYDGGVVCAMHFILRVGQNDLPYRLPVRVQAVYDLLASGRRVRNRADLMEQAKRVAWRQILRWVQAQLALIQTGMVQAAEVFLPYMSVAPKQTFYEKVMLHGANLLTWKPQE